jgi:enolase-phosphatase E1
VSLRFDGIQVVLLDIEGTTTPIRFVYDVLFPFARAGLTEFLRAGMSEADFRALSARFQEELRADRQSGHTPPAWDAASPEAERASVESYVRWLMDADRKSTALKDLQGRMWQQGYDSGQLQAVVFADVPEALRAWRAAGLRTAIFSSGSVLAQRLLFAHTGEGDLTPLIDAYFDTTTGPKQDPASYTRIASALRVAPAHLSFVSDSVDELDAARIAGALTLLSSRPGNPPPRTSHTHQVVHSFAEISL